MRIKHIRDQRGLGVLLELILVAVVLTLAGLAVYQANHRSKLAATQKSSTGVPATPSSAEGIAASAAAITVQQSASDAALSASAETSADQLSQSNLDVSNLGNTSNASF